jgi:hypothetical protein
LASRTVVLTQILGGDPTDQKLVDAAAAQHGFEVGGVERAFAGLVHHRLAMDGGEFGDDVMACLATHQYAAHRPGIADAGGEVAARPLGRREVGQVATMAFACVHDHDAGRTACT